MTKEDYTVLLIPSKSDIAMTDENCISLPHQELKDFNQIGTELFLVKDK